MLLFLEVVGVIWLVGGTWFYIWTYKDSVERLDRACQKYNLPTFIGDVVSYINSVVIGFPYFVYKVVKGLFFDN